VPACLLLGRRPGARRSRGRRGPAAQRAAAPYDGMVILLLVSLALGSSPMAPPSPRSSSSSSSSSSVIAVDARRQTHTVNKLFMGCHSDSGFGHQVRSFYSNLLSGESFEPEPGGATWGQLLLPETARANVTLEGKGAGMHGETALRIAYNSGSGLVGLGNRGFRNEGLFLRGGKEYEGYLFVQANNSVTIEVSVRAYSLQPAVVLARAALPFDGGGGKWTRLNFTLTPSDDAPCEAIAAGSDPTIRCPRNENSSVGHACVRCGAEFVVGLSAPGEVLVDFVVLQPGNWGRYKGLQVHRHTVETLLQMGVTAIRFGGSFVSYYGFFNFWKNWRGPPWARPNVGAHWQQDVMSSWGPFEQIALCNAAGIEPIITVTAQDQVPRHTGPYDCCSSADMAGLIEYCYGNSSTKWGLQRITDGHPAPFRVRFLELGNGRPLYPCCWFVVAAPLHSLSLLRCHCPRAPAPQSSTTPSSCSRCTPWRRVPGRSEWAGSCTTSPRRTAIILPRT
jgi:hypothetical protein